MWFVAVRCSLYTGHPFVYRGASGIDVDDTADEVTWKCVTVSKITNNLFECNRKSMKRMEAGFQILISPIAHEEYHLLRIPT